MPSPSKRGSSHSPSCAESLASSPKSMAPESRSRPNTRTRPSSYSRRQSAASRPGSWTDATTANVSSATMRGLASFIPKTFNSRSGNPTPGSRPSTSPPGAGVELVEDGGGAGELGGRSGFPRLGGRVCNVSNASGCQVGTAVLADGCHSKGVQRLERERLPVTGTSRACGSAIASVAPLAVRWSGLVSTKPWRARCAGRCGCRCSNGPRIARATSAVTAPDLVGRSVSPPPRRSTGGSLRPPSRKQPADPTHSSALARPAAAAVSPSPGRSRIPQTDGGARLARSGVWILLVSLPRRRTPATSASSWE